MHSVKNDGKSAINRITLDDLVDEKGKVIVKEKTLMTAKDAEALSKTVKTPEIEVRGYLTDAYEYFDAYQERRLVIAEANTKRDSYDNFTDTRLACRRQGEATFTHVREVTHMDISPKQIMSETTMLIPFVEHDDATRAEMGTNMMRQAVPLLRAEAPRV